MMFVFRGMFYFPTTTHACDIIRRCKDLVHLSIVNWECRDHEIAALLDTIQADCLTYPLV